MKGMGKEGRERKEREGKGLVMPRSYCFLCTCISMPLLNIYFKQILCLQRYSRLLLLCCMCALRFTCSMVIVHTVFYNQKIYLCTLCAVSYIICSYQLKDTNIITNIVPLARASHVKWRYTKYLGFSFNAVKLVINVYSGVHPP